MNSERFHLSDKTGFPLSEKTGFESPEKAGFPLNNKGAAMAEAAMIFPLVLAGVMAVIYIIINLYLSLVLQTSLHTALRKECGEHTQTVFRIETVQDSRRQFQQSLDWDGVIPVIRMEQEREYRIKSIFAQRITRKEEGRSYAIDEAETDRVLSILPGE